METFQGLVQGTVIFYWSSIMNFLPWRTSDWFCRQILRSLFESWWEEHCEFCQYQLEIFPMRRMVADSTGTNQWSELSESALVPWEREEIKDTKGSFNSHGGLFWWLPSFSWILSPFGEKYISAWYFSKKSQSNDWIGVETLRRKGYVSLKGPT